MKLIKTALELKKQIFSIVAESKDELIKLKKVSLLERIANVKIFALQGWIHIKKEPEIIVIALIQFVLMLAVFALIGFSIFALQIHYDAQNLAKEAFALRAFFFVVPLFYVLFFISGISNGAIGVSSFLHQVGQESTLVKCYRIAFQSAGRLSVFMLLNHWIGKKGKKSSRGPLSSLGGGFVRFAWHLLSMGMPPALLNGRNFKEALFRSVELFRQNMVEVAAIRLAYQTILFFASLIPLAFISLPVLLESLDIDVFSSLSVNSENILSIAIGAGALWLLFTLFFFLIIKPIYVSVVYHLYGKFLQENNYSIEIKPRKPVSKSLFFVGLILICYMGLSYMMSSSLLLE